MPANLLAVLGPEAAPGRTFAASDVNGKARVAVVSYHLRRQHMNGMRSFWPWDKRLGQKSIRSYGTLPQVQSSTVRTREKTSPGLIRIPFMKSTSKGVAKTVALGSGAFPEVTNGVEKWMEGCLFDQPPTRGEDARGQHCADVLFLLPFGRNSLQIVYR